MFRELTLEEIRSVYKTHMKQDFPARELKPLKNIEHMRAKGDYSCYGLFQGEELKAYAMVSEPGGASMVLLDYLAAVRTDRSSGHGSRMLSLLKKRYAGRRGILIEAEDPAYSEDEADREVRMRRIRFYEKNGARETGVYGDVFGTDYTVLILETRGEGRGQEPDAEALREEVRRQYDQMYRMMVPGVIRGTFVKIHTKPEHR